MNETYYSRNLIKFDKDVYIFADQIAVIRIDDNIVRIHTSANFTFEKICEDKTTAYSYAHILMENIYPKHISYLNI